MPGAQSISPTTFRVRERDWGMAKLPSDLRAAPFMGKPQLLPQTQVSLPVRSEQRKDCFSQSLFHCALRMKIPERGAPETKERQSKLDDDIFPTTCVPPIDQLGTPSSLCLKKRVTILHHTCRRLFLQPCPHSSQIQGRRSQHGKLRTSFCFCCLSDRG